MCEREMERYLAYLRTERGVADNTGASYSADLKRMRKYFAEIKGAEGMIRATKEDLEDYVGYLEKKGLSSATICRNVVSIKAFFQYCCAKEGLAKNPAKNLMPPKIDRKSPEVLSFREVDALLERPSGKGPKGLRDKAMLELLYATGLRVSELLQLRLEDINLETCHLQCRGRKRLRCIPFGSSVTIALRNYLSQGRGAYAGAEESSFLFFNCQGRPMSRQGFWKLLKGYAKEAGIQTPITPNTLRHSFVAHLLQSGSDVKRVQELLGSTDFSAVQIYAYLDLYDIRSVYDRTHPRK